MARERNDLTDAPDEMSTPFIGVDAGGTRTRALVAIPTGAILGSGQAGGANVWSSGASIATVVGTAMREALGSLDPASVGGGVIAMAGAGTGSIAAVIEDGGIVRRAGGHGWLLGDEGSAVWLGIGAIRSTLRALDGRGPSTSLAASIPPTLGIEEDDPGAVALRIVSESHGRPPADLGRLAHVVVDAAEGGDAVARELLESGAAELVELLVTALGGQEPAVIVLAGALLASGGPLADPVRAIAAARWPGTAIVEATSGEVGAVALAIRLSTGRPTTRAWLHRVWAARPG